ncbi:MAG: phosphoribosylaminoimidazolesuccinocarboxamide synthase [Planctomycetota bacterium]|nr:MAG: phosphoribosylaminoimidazolesuccinocarboxamide synthase [Planctomycetota bacterium]
MKQIGSGKVREIFELPKNRLLLVATDRISAYDVVFPTPIPGKGKILTQISKFWFHQISFMKHHWREEEETKEFWNSLKEADWLTEEWRKEADLPNRSMLVEKGKVIPFECIVRGYAFGSYLKHHPEVAPMTPFSPPLFTPTTKAVEGHDEKVDFEVMEKELGSSLAHAVRQASLELFEFGKYIARSKGLVLVDTKFEFALDPDGKLMLIDEIFTPDSSRYFLKEDIEKGKMDSSMDKQYFRQYLDSVGFHDGVPPMEIPEEVVKEIQRRYQMVYHRLTSS